MNNFNGLHNLINNVRHRQRQGRLREEEALEPLPRTKRKKLMPDLFPWEPTTRPDCTRRKKK